MADEVKITASLDTDGISSGVQRVEQAAQKMKRSLEEGATPDLAKAAEDGEMLGDALSGGFLRKFLTRDALKTALRGFMDAMKEAAKEINDLTGWKIETDPVKAWGHIMTQAAMGNDKVSGATITQAEGNINNIKQDEKTRTALDRWKASPETFNISTEQVERNLEKAKRQKAEDEISNQRYHENMARAGQDLGAIGGVVKAYKPGGGLGSGGASITDDELKESSKRSDKEIAYLNEQLAIAKTRDAKEEKDRNEAVSADKAKWRKEDEEAARMNRELQQSIQKSIQEARAHEKKLAEQAKKEAHLKLEQEERADHEKKHKAEVDLHETERNIHAQKATSAQRIQGGLYGKSDSAAALVQHAAQQIGLLRGIEMELKAIRAQKDQLTLS